MAKTKPEINDDPASHFFPSHGVAEIENAFSKLPSEDKLINLYRVKDHGPPAFLTKLTPSTFDLALIEERFGGGNYKAIGTDQDTGYNEERDFVIDGDPRKTPIPSTVLLGTPKAEREDRPDHLIQRLDRLETVLEKIIDKVFDSRQDTGDSEERFLKKLMICKEMFASPTQPQTNVDASALMGMFTKGLEAVNGAEAPTWMTFARELMPHIQDIISKVATGSKGVPMTGPKATEAIPEPELPKTGFLSLAPMIQPFMITFIDAAAKDDDPSFLVPMVTKRIPGDKKEVVIEWLKSDKWFLDLQSLDQRITFQQGWWQEFTTNLLAELTGEKSPDSGYEPPDGGAEMQ